MTLSEQLAQWRNWLARLDAPVAPALLPGADRTAIGAALGPTVPPAVLDWFTWCDGVGHQPGQTIGDTYAIPGYWPISLRDAVEVKPIHADPDDPLLAEHWIPLLENGSSDLYVAVWSDGTEPAVASIMPEYGPASVEFDSIPQMVAVFNACFARSAYFLDDEGQLDVDDDRYAEIYQEIVGRHPDRDDDEDL
ncbi:hypothetical protein ACFP2T_46160 [Plantactinospora solaniradicis]|uniref:Knr4/Smi1-like domain-containing protein n=1 Tax=Plantactinospora solaniradicis TaxID=1723736 RepID=A0ABW1KRQ4_9ACTN